MYIYLGIPIAHIYVGKLYPILKKLRWISSSTFRGTRVRRFGWLTYAVYLPPPGTKYFDLLQTSNTNHTARAVLLLRLNTLEFRFSFCQNPYSCTKSEGATTFPAWVVTKLGVANQGYELSAGALVSLLLSRKEFVVMSVPSGPTTPGSSGSEDSWYPDGPTAAALKSAWTGAWPPRFAPICCLFLDHGFTMGSPVYFFAGHGVMV